MQATDSTERETVSVTTSVWVFVSLAGVTVALTVVWLSMRAVLDLGGFCASGGPYVIETTCPKGVAGLMIGGMWGGLIAAGAYAWASAKHEGPNFLWLLWPALFLSLGYNFLQFAIDPPGDAGGIIWGWMICAILFILMGGIPLVGVLLSHRPGHQPKAVTHLAMQALLAARAAGSSRRTWPSAGAGIPPDPATSADEMVTQLERLAALRVNGSLSDEEYAAAKRRLIGDGGIG